MSINARSKGQVGEREVADMLNSLVLQATGTLGDFKRNLMQTQDGGFDLVSFDYPYFAFEVKRVEALTPAVVDGFWAQAKRQATQANPVNPMRKMLPVLIYRKNRSPWRVRTYGTLAWSTDQFVVDVSIESFNLWFLGRIKAIHDKRNET